jgi:hypothetical protein
MNSNLTRNRIEHWLQHFSTFQESKFTQDIPRFSGYCAVGRRIQAGSSEFLEDSPGIEDAEGRTEQAGQ